MDINIYGKFGGILKRRYAMHEWIETLKGLFGDTESDDAVDETVGEEAMLFITTLRISEVKI